MIFKRWQRQPSHLRGQIHPDRLGPCRAKHHQAARATKNASSGPHRPSPIDGPAGARRDSTPRLRAPQPLPPDASRGANLNSCWANRIIYDNQEHAKNPTRGIASAYLQAVARLGTCLLRCTARHSLRSANRFSQSSLVISAVSR